ncbi:MAG: hypothetical protein U0Q03_01915 [Acidimicrobiales bacterium]
MFAQRVRDLHELVADVGPPVWVADVTAGALLGFDDYELVPSSHLVVPRGRNVSRIGHVVHTALEIPLIDRAEVFGLPVTSATRTIVDLARTQSLERLTTAIDSATRDRLTSDDFLHRRLVELSGRGRPGASRLLQALRGIEITRGGHSWLERRFLQLCRDALLPAPLTQCIAGRRADRLIRVDCRFDGTPVVVELLGYAFHRTTAQMANDAERMNRMVIEGLCPVQFTYSQVVETPQQVIGAVSEALRRR